MFARTQEELAQMVVTRRECVDRGQYLAPRRRCRLFGQPTLTSWPRWNRPMGWNGESMSDAHLQIETAYRNWC